MQRTPNLALLSGQPLYRLEAIVIIKVDLEGTANTIMQDKWPEDSRREPNTPAINTVRENGFDITFV